MEKRDVAYELLHRCAEEALHKSEQTLRMFVDHALGRVLPLGRRLGISRSQP